jgi:uncharacterized alpha-E superfamily protein
MLSRVAELVYWMSRYVERAENVARVVDVNLHLMLDAPPGFEQQWPPLIQTTGDHEAFARRHREATRDSVLHFLTFDPDNPNSILSCLSAARENARTVREIISSDMWEQINRFYLMLCAANSGNQVLRSPHEFFSQVKLASQLFSGTTDNSLTHGEAWHFTRLGRMLERADQTSRILDVKYYILLRSVEDIGSPVDDIHWAAVLRSASAFEMYGKRHGRISPGGVVEFLLLDPDFPRAIRYSLLAARDSLHAISGTPPGTYRLAPERCLGQLCSDLAYASVDDVLAKGVHESVDELQADLNRVGQGISETFFALRTPQSARPILRSPRS